eukprot:2325833-Prymnesium_polylepis.1
MCVTWRAAAGVDAAALQAGGLVHHLEECAGYVPYYYLLHVLLRVRQLGLRGSAPKGHWSCLSSARRMRVPWR